MTDKTREPEAGNDLEAQDGEILPAREVMSVISTDPTDTLLPAPEGDYSIDPVQEKGDEFATLPVEPRGA